MFPSTHQTLEEVENKLDPVEFIRVHESAIMRRWNCGDGWRSRATDWPPVLYGAKLLGIIDQAVTNTELVVAENGADCAEGIGLIAT